ncbi:hypothetical protein [Acinetobacter pollinis]|uniref:hypothetical protein n=2 Tax=Acinetobacter pollinis TaxID=2605270 RepID=UPI0018A2F7B4|nr:hypothetical protein [Acinetobacter pollinis]
MFSFERRIMRVVVFLFAINILGFTAVYAQPGYRICIVSGDNESNLNFLEKGLAVKVANGNGNNTCEKKMNYMTKYYLYAYPEDKLTFINAMGMAECEKVSRLIGADSNICKSMKVNKIYKYSSRYGEDAVANPSATFWHN